VNHRFLSGPAMIPAGPLAGVGMGNSMIAPETVIRPIMLPENWVNQRFASGPPVTPVGTLSGVGIGNSAKSPEVVTRPILLPPKDSVNHRFPSGITGGPD